MSNGKKRIIKDLQLFEISGVEKPAQEYATISIVKNFEETPMTVENNNSELDEAKEAIESLRSEVQNFKFMDELDNEVREHFKALDAGQQEAAKAKGSVKFNEEFKASQVEDKVIYKCLDGTEIKQSDGEKLLKIAKENDELRVEKQMKEEEVKNIEFKALAEKEFSNLSGDIDIKVQLLKSIESLEVKDEILAMLKGANAANAEVFVEKGSQTIVESNGTSDFIQLVKKYQTENPDVKYDQAFQIVSRSPEGRKAYSEHRKSDDTSPIRKA